VALHASSFVGTLQPTLAPTVMYILCLARSHWQRVGAGACDEDLGLNLTKRGLAVPAAADSEWPASGVAAASGPELGRIPADRPGRQGTPLAKLSFCQCAARAGPAGTSSWHCSQLRAWGKGQGAWAVRSAEARSLAGRVSLGLGRSPDSEHEIRPLLQWQSPPWPHGAITPAGSGASDARSCHGAHRYRA
jgi:hypothetical protein